MKEREEIHNLLQMINEMADGINYVLNSALKSLKGNAEEILKELNEKDEYIDNLENLIDSKCLRILALYQPEADDLRTVTMALKINNDLERIGDHSINIAERAVTLGGGIPDKISKKIDEMGSITKTMLSDVITAYIAKDSATAKSVLVKDDEIDLLLKEIIKLAVFDEEGRSLPSEHILAITSIARELERIADLITNICEDIVFMADGINIKHSRET